MKCIKALAVAVSIPAYVVHLYSHTGFFINQFHTDVGRDIGFYVCVLCFRTPCKVVNPIIVKLLF